MTEPAFAPAPPVLAAVEGGGVFPVGRIFCVGQNYADHAKEMGARDREAPFFFTKWAQAVVPTGSTLPYPPVTANFHHEGELVVALGGGGRDIAREDAMACVWGFAAGLDMTRRDLQAEAKKAGRPWDTAKNVEGGAPLGPIRPAARAGDLSRGALELSVNGETRQRGDLADMIWPVPDIVAFLSKLYRLQAGDLVFTGTPAGVGPVSPGDRIALTIADLPPLEIVIGPPSD